MHYFFSSVWPHVWLSSSLKLGWKFSTFRGTWYKVPSKLEAPATSLQISPFLSLKWWWSHLSTWVTFERFQGETTRFRCKVYSRFFNNWNCFLRCIFIDDWNDFLASFRHEATLPLFHGSSKGGISNSRARARSGPGDRSDKLHHYRLSGSSLRSPHIRPAVRVSDSPFSFIIPIKNINEQKCKTKICQHKLYENICEDESFKTTTKWKNE